MYIGIVAILKKRIKYEKEEFGIAVIKCLTRGEMQKNIMITENLK